MVGIDPSWKNLYKEIQYHPNNKPSNNIIERTTTFQKQERKKRKRKISNEVYNPIVLLYIVHKIEKHKILATNKENNQAHQPKRQRKRASTVE